MWKLPYKTTLTQKAAADVFSFLSGVERICWSVMVVPLLLIGHVSGTPHLNVYSFTYLFIGWWPHHACMCNCGQRWHSLPVSWAVLTCFKRGNDPQSHTCSPLTQTVWCFFFFFVLSETPVGAAQHSFVLDKGHLELICGIKTEPEFQSVTWQDPLVRSLTSKPQKPQDHDVLQAGVII